MERKRTPRQLIEFGIRLHLAGLSLSNTVRELEEFGVEHSCKAVHDWDHKCDLQPADDEKSNHVAVDETVVQLNKYRYWLYTVVDPKANNILQIRLYSTTTTALTDRFLQELSENLDVDNTMFFVDSGP